MVRVNLSGIHKASMNKVPDDPVYGRVKNLLQSGDRWPSLLRQLGIPAASLHGKHCPCPGCGGKDRFRFVNKDGSGSFICSQGTGEIVAGNGWTLLQHVYGWSFEKSLAEIAALLLPDVSPKALAYRSAPALRSARSIPTSSAGLRDVIPAATPMPHEKPVIIDWAHLAPDAQKRLEYLEKLQKESVPLHQLTEKTHQRMVQNYFLSRGLGENILLPSHISFHPHLKNSRENWSGPALIAWVTRPVDGPLAFASGKIVGMQRLWLDPRLQTGPQLQSRGKAPLKQAKMSFGIFDQSMVGSSVHLYGSENSPLLVVAEGIETALSWLRLQSMRGTLSSASVHACLGTSQIKSWYSPVAYPATVVLQDNDPAGLRACNDFCRLHPGAKIVAPPAEHNDFNDYLMSLSPPSSNRSLSAPCP
ncbi:primase-helicase zinc-binding domain-containing protein [Acidithiobacillus thiooxidans]|uniref:primase-helicase zinc-binding domain-containing protein n=1 Tax=Acidithiobacillus thiooxidans TaxID=930 RepID=UPI003561EC34|nr:primase-helicase zinc-binding domain-containing protein [Acidithiobacillus sp.]